MPTFSPTTSSAPVLSDATTSVAGGTSATPGDVSSRRPAQVTRTSTTLIDTLPSFSTDEAASFDHVPRQFARPVSPGRYVKLRARHLLLGLVMAALAVWVTRYAWLDLLETAQPDGENSHVYLVPFVVAWLFWVRRQRLPLVRVAGRSLGPVMVLAGWLIGSYGFNTNAAVFWHLGALVAVMGAVVSITGKGIMFRFIPVAGALLFLIPVPGELRSRISLPLQHWTAEISAEILQTAGVRAVVMGNTLEVNDQLVRIAEACNGMRMVFALLLVTYAFCFAWPLRNSVRWALLIMSPLVALMCNVLRTVPTIWLHGYASDTAAYRFHDIAGWAMLPLAFLILLGIVRALRWMAVPVERYHLAGRAA